MSGELQVSIGREASCRRLGHRAEMRELPTGDRVECCVECSTAWSGIYNVAQDEVLADEFVAFLRSEPYRGAWDRSDVPPAA